MPRLRARRPSVAAARRAVRRAPRPWVRLSDEELLKVRFCDLKLSIERSPLARHVRRLYEELERRGLPVRPHVWLSEEWFSPDGVPGIAVPFYLAHPRLERLERRIMREAEGGNTRLLRCASCATRPGTRSTTPTACAAGAAGAKCSVRPRCPYPARYRARAGSRRYVHHLGEWYAQAHPTEDFAETFAVWLKPQSGWRKSYAGWPALHKLQAVDELMASVRGRRAPVRNRTLHRAAACQHAHPGAALPPQAGAQPHDPPRARRRAAAARVHAGAAAPRGAARGDPAARGRARC